MLADVFVGVAVTSSTGQLVAGAAMAAATAATPTLGCFLVV
ncbi:MAG: hypothetical protein ACRC6G_06600 [Deefgea sp.]